jgi:hypothetical protein
VDFEIDFILWALALWASWLHHSSYVITGWPTGISSWRGCSWGPPQCPRKSLGTINQNLSVSKTNWVNVYKIIKQCVSFMWAPRLTLHSLGHPMVKISGFTWTNAHCLTMLSCEVRDDPKLLGDSGEVPNSGWSGWQFDFRCEIFSPLDEKN